MLAGRPTGCSEGTTVHTTNTTAANSSTSTSHINNINSSNSSGANSSGVIGGLDVYTAVERLRGLAVGDTARTVLHAMQNHPSDAALQVLTCLLAQLYSTHHGDYLCGAAESAIKCTLLQSMRYNAAAVPAVITHINCDV
jgi:hypothetical protein